MKNIGSTSISARLCVSVACATIVSTVKAGVPTTSPSAQDEVKALMEDVRDANTKLAPALPAHTFGDPVKRQAAAGKAIPLLQRIETDFDRIIAVKPASKRQLASGQRQAMAMLAVLGDKQSIDALRSMVNDKNPQVSLRGKSGQLLARWYVAESDAPAQAGIVDALDNLDHDNAKDNGLTILTMDMSRSAATPQLRERLQMLATDGMSSAASIAIKNQLASAAEHKAQVDAILSKLLNKPMTINGVQPDGSVFSTGNWKGKVVLVDFWATWCGPCKAELPRIKQTYTQYHPKGLELVGVSNDYNVDALKKFVVDQQMPWPEVVDASAAADQQWNPITLGFGISGIPTMFLIDKKGVARSVTAREDLETMIPKLLAEAD